MFRPIISWVYDKALQHLPYTFMFGLRMSSRKIKDTHYVDANVLANLFFLLEND